MKIELLDDRPLRFSAPFGDGEDRHEGVRAASSIVRLGDAWLFAQDDSNFAAVLEHGVVTPLRLFVRGASDTFSEAQGNKKQKPDLECGTELVIEGRPAAVFFGSGSRAQRMTAALVTRTPEGLQVKLADLSSLYAAALQLLALPATALNLEGACTLKDTVRLFQRGNDPATRVNASFEVALPALLDALLHGDAVTLKDLSAPRRHELGLIAGAPLGFSAADALPDGRVLFAASAESSPDTYRDGACAGSVLGLIGEDGVALESAPLPCMAGEIPLKIEGLAVKSLEPDGATVLCATDADDPELPSRLLTLRLRF